MGRRKPCPAIERVEPVETCCMCGCTGARTVMTRWGHRWYCGDHESIAAKLAQEQTVGIGKSGCKTPEIIHPDLLEL